MINHIAWIMDGNRRYSKKQNISLKAAYKIGMEQFITVLKFQISEKINNTSFFALSSDNYKKRSEFELKTIVNLIEDFFKNEEVSNFLITNEFNIHIKGDIKKLETGETFLKKKEVEFLRTIENKCQEINQKVQNPKFSTYIAINYDGEEELVHSFKQLLKKGIKPEEITSKKIKENIYFNDVKAPEIIVRPGDANRISGFLLFDSKYSEIYLTKKLWPELTNDDFKEILNWYSKQKINFGK